MQRRPKKRERRREYYDENGALNSFAANFSGKVCGGMPFSKKPNKTAPGARKRNAKRRNGKLRKAKVRSRIVDETSGSRTQAGFFEGAGSERNGMQVMKMRDGYGTIGWRQKFAKRTGIGSTNEEQFEISL